MIRELLEARAGEDYDLYARGINPQFMRVLKTIGFDRVWARAEGQYLYDSDGNRFLDMLGGFGMFNAGRNNPRIRAALAETLELDTPGSVQLGVSLLPGLLAEELLKRTPARLARVLFTSSGAEAVEAALKLGRAATGRSRVVSTERPSMGSRSAPSRRVTIAISSSASARSCLGSRRFRSATSMHSKMRSGPRMSRSFSSSPCRGRE